MGGRVLHAALLEAGGVHADRYPPAIDNTIMNIHSKILSETCFPYFCKHGYLSIILFSRLKKECFALRHNKMTAHGDGPCIQNTMLANEETCLLENYSDKKQRLRHRASLMGFAALSVVSVLFWIVVSTVETTRLSFSSERSVADVMVVESIAVVVSGAACFHHTHPTILKKLIFVFGWLMTAVLSKFWMFRAYRDFPLGTGFVVYATVAAALRMYCCWKLEESNDPRIEQKLKCLHTRELLFPFLFPGCCLTRVLSCLSWVVVIGSKVCVIAAPAVLGKIVDMLSERDSDELTKYLLIFGALKMAPELLKEVQDHLYIHVWKYAYGRVAETTFRHVHSLSLDWHLKKNMGSVVRTMDCGLQAADTLMYYSMMHIGPSIGAAIAAFIYFVVEFEQPEVAAMCFFGLTTYIWITLALTVERCKVKAVENVHDGSMHDATADSLTNFETVKCFTNEDHETRLYLESLKEFQTSSTCTHTLSSMINTSQSTIEITTLVGSLMVAAWAVVRNEDGLGVGDFVAIEAYIALIFEPLSLLSVMFSLMITSLVDFTDLAELLSEEPDVFNCEHAAELGLPKTGSEIRFENVSFNYPSQLPQSGLHNVSFTIKPGTTTAVVGATGSGKTTLSRLLFRFYAPNEGAILINGIDIRSVSQNSLRKNVGIVPQDVTLFNKSIEYNIQYGAVDKSQEEVRMVAEHSRCTEFISRMASGYDTVVGERGLRLSGGEKQRIAIARCLLKDPPIVVLDEATSALDNNTEHDIQEALKQFVGRTTMVIAHRLSTIQAADQIVVLDHGRVAEVGTHESLSAKEGGYYSELLRNATNDSIRGGATDGPTPEDAHEDASALETSMRVAAPQDRSHEMGFSTSTRKPTG